MFLFQLCLPSSKFLKSLTYHAAAYRDKINKISRSMISIYTIQEFPAQIFIDIIIILILQHYFLKIIFNLKGDWLIEFLFSALFDLISRSDIYRKKFCRFWTRRGIRNISPLAKRDDSNMILKIKLHLPTVRTVDYLGCHITNKEDKLLID